MSLIKLLVLILSFMATSARAEVTEQFSISHYTIDLVSGKSLLSQFNAASTIRKDGRVYHGYTRWTVKWFFRWNTDALGVCRIVSASTQLDVEMILPYPRGASSSQSGIVTAYGRALRAHEQGHYDIARQAAHEIDLSLLGMPGMADCKTLEQSANSKANETFVHFKEASRQYDRDTQYGKTQGAVLEGGL